MTDRNRWDEDRRRRTSSDYRDDDDDSSYRRRSTTPYGGYGSDYSSRQSNQQDYSGEYDRDQNYGSGSYNTGNYGSSRDSGSRDSTSEYRSGGRGYGSDRSYGSGSNYGSNDRSGGRYDRGTEYQTSSQRYAGTGYSHYGSRPSASTGDYFGAGDFGSGAHAWDRNSTQSYAGSGRYGSIDNPSGLTGEMGRSYAPGSYDRNDARQPWQRESRTWDDQERNGQRGFLERAGDEVMSWFGDEDAARRREQDHRGMGPSDYTRSDDRVREDANDRLTDDPRIDARNVSVSVENGEVTLSGTVSSRDAKHRAEECIENISGVKHVQNNLRVDSSALSSGGTTGNTSASWNRSGSGSTTGTTSELTTPGMTTGSSSSSGDTGAKPRGTTTGSTSA